MKQTTVNGTQISSQKWSRNSLFLSLTFLLVSLGANASFAHNHNTNSKDSAKAHSHAGHNHDAEKKESADDLKSLSEKPKDVIVNVNGMVCSFCTSNIEKRFKKEKAVKDVLVNLDEKKVYLNFKDKASLTDEQITANIKKAGYNVVSIERN